MNKEKFTNLARSTGANECIDFNWSLQIKNSCMKEFQKDILLPCLLLQGKECDCMRRGNE